MSQTNSQTGVPPRDKRSLPLNTGICGQQCVLNLQVFGDEEKLNFIMFTWRYLLMEQTSKI
jgi:hypothetical protein